jgi:hypothetical protein
MSAQVVWRDTEARSLAQTVDALGKLVQMLGVPPEVLWEKIPGVTQTDVKRWQDAAEKGDAIAQLDGMIDRQMSPAVPAPNGSRVTASPTAEPPALTSGRAG